MKEENIKLEEVPTDVATPGKINAPVIVIVVALLALGGFYLMNKGAKNEVVSTATQVGTTQESSMVAPVDDAIIVTGGNFKYAPNEIRVKKGEKVTITFKNEEGMHDFRVDEFNVKTSVIGEGKEETVSITPDKAGTFEYYCSVGSHRKMGMVGKLIVE